MSRNQARVLLPLGVQSTRERRPHHGGGHRKVQKFKLRQPYWEGRKRQVS